MDRLLSLLLFAGLFYLMMRFGCGAHMIHGSHGSKGNGDSEQGSEKDPVCGMPVESGQGYSKRFEGKVLRFCSKQCLDKVDAEPRRYAA